MLRTVWCSGALLLGLVADRPQANPPIAFTNVTVVDVESGRLLPGMLVVIQGDRIREVTGERATAPRNARVIDATGKFLIPGLWDMHVHAAFPQFDKQFLSLLVANGITGVREMFSRLDWVDSSRARISRRAFPGPRIVASGHILDGAPPIWPGSVVGRNAEEARRAVDSLFAAGADFIKVYSRLSPEAFFAAGRAARGRGLRFEGHVPGLVRVRDASDSGIRSIEHLTGLLSACSTVEDSVLAQVAAAVASPKGWDSAGIVSRGWGRRLMQSYSPERCREVARVLVKNGTWMVPTTVVLRSTAYLDDSTLARDPRLAYIPPGFSQSWNPANDFRFRMLTPADWAGRKAVYARQLELVALLHQEGVSFLAGTDLANPYIYPGFSLHDELATLVSAGFTPLEALRTATLNPAKYLGTLDTLGTVSAGKRADLVLLDANPLENIRNASRISAVITAGRVLERKELDRLLAAAKLR